LREVKEKAREPWMAGGLYGKSGLLELFESAPPSQIVVGRTTAPGPKPREIHRGRIRSTVGQVNRIGGAGKGTGAAAALRFKILSRRIS